MALFGEKKKKVAKDGVRGTKVVSKVTPTDKVDAKKTANNAAILRPRITEKATMKADAENVYVFEIAKTATKGAVRQAVISTFNVKPVKVAIAYNPSKRIFSRGKMGTVSGVKKAYVYLKKGDKIEII